MFTGGTCSIAEHRREVDWGMQYGQVLRKVRKKAGLTQEEMAERIHMSRPNVSKIERDQIELKMSDAIRWCQATNMPEVAAAMLCGVDPVVLTNFINNLPTLLQMTGVGFIRCVLNLIF